MEMIVSRRRNENRRSDNCNIADKQEGKMNQYELNALVVGMYRVFG